MLERDELERGGSVVVVGVVVIIERGLAVVGVEVVRIRG